MKFALLFALILIVSCGKIDMAGTAGVGGVRQFSQLEISKSDQQIFTQICQALKVKSTKLTSTKPNSLVFDVVEKDCAGKTVTFNSQQVRVEDSGSGFQFRRQDTNSLFLFPNVETNTDGFMTEICGGASALPSKRGDTEAVWVSTGGYSSTDCPTASQEQCLVVEYGTKQAGSDSYLIHTIEFVRFNLKSTDGKYGYFTHRKAVATNNCDLGDSTQSQATLR